MNRPLEGVEPVIKMLCSLLVFFTAVVIFCEWRFQQDGQVFQVFSNILSGITGAILMRVKPPHVDGDDKSTNIVGKIVETQPQAEKP